MENITKKEHTLFVGDVEDIHFTEDTRSVHLVALDAHLSLESMLGTNIRKFVRTIWWAGRSVEDRLLGMQEAPGSKMRMGVPTR